jgi:hypothetical protein
LTCTSSLNPTCFAFPLLFDAVDEAEWDEAALFVADALRVVRRVMGGEGNEPEATGEPGNRERALEGKLMNEQGKNS